jgi:Importin-beta N-terminal domain
MSELTAAFPLPSLQRTAAESILKQLQAHPDAWTRVDAILEQSQTQQAKFYALQVCGGGFSLKGGGGDTPVMLCIFGRWGRPVPLERRGSAGRQTDLPVWVCLLSAAALRQTDRQTDRPLCIRSVIRLRSIAAARVSVEDIPFFQSSAMVHPAPGGGGDVSELPCARRSWRRS